MKNYLIILILSLCFTCWLADSGQPPTEQPMGISNVLPITYGEKKQEGMIPDFVFTDKQQPSNYATKIDEDSVGQQLDFPWGTR